MTRSAFARLADEELEERAKKGAACATINVAAAVEKTGLTPAQLLLEAAYAARQGEVRINAVEVEPA